MSHPNKVQTRSCASLGREVSDCCKGLPGGRHRPSWIAHRRQILMEARSTEGNFVPHCWQTSQVSDVARSYCSAEKVMVHMIKCDSVVKCSWVCPDMKSALVIMSIDCSEHGWCLPRVAHLYTCTKSAVRVDPSHITEHTEIIWTDPISS